MKVSFILLAHEPPEQLRPLISCLLDSGSNVYIHYDANTKQNLQHATQGWALESYKGNLYFSQREKIAWGEWSIVQATINCLTRWQEVGDSSDYLMLISGTCLPIKPLNLLCKHLSENQLNYIETVNAVDGHWVSHGDQTERWSHYKFFSWRKYPKAFAMLTKLQNKLRISRKLPLGHTPHIGSQWWCLRSDTVTGILELIKDNPGLRRFYKYTWIPDEFFFQTMVANAVTSDKISHEPLMMYSFNSRGVSESRYDDSFISLMRSEAFFSRKISPHAKRLHRQIKPVFTMTEEEFIAYRESLCDEQSSEYLSELGRVRKARANEWHTFVSSEYKEATYCNSIPNNIIVICGGTWEQRIRLSRRFSKFHHVSSFGHLFHTGFVDFGGVTESVAGYAADHHKLAQHRWPYFLGDICKVNSGKTVVFCLGDNAVKFIDVLKHKNGLAVLLLSEDTQESPDVCESMEVERKKFYTHIRIEKSLIVRACDFFRLDEKPDDDFLGFVAAKLQY